MSSGDGSVELFQGTLDLIVPRALSTMRPLHAYALANRPANVSSDPLSLNQGSLYPALVRLEQQGFIKGKWQNTEAKFYSISKSDERALAEKVERWNRVAELVQTLLVEG